ncbi:hypothetical protein PFISCL1PPCAC_22432, partial [Pristionchus fissidentatus]
IHVISKTRISVEVGDSEIFRVSSAANEAEPEGVECSGQPEEEEKTEIDPDVRDAALGVEPHRRRREEYDQNDFDDFIIVAHYSFFGV